MIDRVLIAIPAFNEEQTIARVVLGAKPFGDVLVVNDGSSDATESVSRVAGATVISSEANQGYECSLRLAYDHALREAYNIMVTIDADGQLPVGYIPEFLGEIKGGSSLVVGKRRRIPRFTERWLAFLSSTLCGLHDPYCGMKAYQLRERACSTFSVYNSVGTSLALTYLELGLSITNLEIDVAERVGSSRFGGLVRSEIQLFPSVLIGQYRIGKVWMKRLLRQYD